MTSLRWHIWQFILRKAARRHGFFDPVDFIAKMRQLSQPSEVQEPIELIRAGAMFHARGLLNTKVIQNNLDWVWPYWVSRQFNPRDKSFIPRAFSFSHVNLTHRNWSAITAPGFETWPIVDPRGMVTPHYDGWSIEHGILDSSGQHHCFSERDEARQSAFVEQDFQCIKTTIEFDNGIKVESTSRVYVANDRPVLQTILQQVAGDPIALLVSVRPANPEGVQFIPKIKFANNTCTVDGTTQIEFQQDTDEFVLSQYSKGDALNHLSEGLDCHEVHCSAGLATGAFLFNAQESMNKVVYEVPLPSKRTGSQIQTSNSKALERTADIKIPQQRFSEIFYNAKYTMRMLSDGEIVPGPYTYRRFWFRDACLMGNALIGINADSWLDENLASFSSRQRYDGYFHSQEGEWDSNGQVLWIINRYEAASGKTCTQLSDANLEKAAKWIVKKRKRTQNGDPRHTGLLPPGFSAEHLGPNDYYFWDDFWGIAGLDAAAQIFDRRDDSSKAEQFRQEAEAFRQDFRNVLDHVKPRQFPNAIPASPYRRMDSGAIGSMVADYPLNIEDISKDRVLATADWIYKNNRLHGAFFQDMIHSGMNAYLTLDLAQTFLKHDDERWFGLVQAVADLATDTGNWPEAIHPHTFGGCMGDGQHGWAAAEWCLMMRSLFVLEDGKGLQLGKGLIPQWFHSDSDVLAFGPTMTPWGLLSVSFFKKDNQWYFQGNGSWNKEAPTATIRCPAFAQVEWDGNPEPISLEMLPNPASPIQ